MENVDSILFLDYIISNGFNPENYDGILELFSSARKSMSRELTDYNQFLLSRNLDYSELEEFGLNGALGYLNEDGIRIPRTIASDDKFLNSKIKGLYGKHFYPVPTMNHFGVIIGNGLGTDLISIPKFSKDHFLGACVDSDDKDLDVIVQIYEKIVEYYNSISDERYRLARDIDSPHNKELLLVTSAPVKVLVKELTYSDGKSLTR